MTQEDLQLRLDELNEMLALIAESRKALAQLEDNTEAIAQLQQVRACLSTLIAYLQDEAADFEEQLAQLANG